MYEIDYRGPETHNSRPPPETVHGKPPYIHHKTSAAGSADAHIGGKSKLRSAPSLTTQTLLYIFMFYLWY